jgi:small subunit ribosomal protein S1
VRVKILEIDSERRRLSLSIKRVEGQVLPVRPIVPPTESDVTDLDDVPELGLSEDVFAAPEIDPEPLAADPEGAAQAQPDATAPEAPAGPAAAADPAPAADGEASAYTEDPPT